MNGEGKENIEEEKRIKKANQTAGIKQKQKNMPDK